jgi:mercuric ion binding protein
MQKTERFKVTGMTSAGCANVVARALRGMGGVRDVTVSFTAHDAQVEYDAAVTSPDKLKLAVSGAGYGVEPADSVN